HSPSPPAYFSLHSYAAHRDLHSFPTRRSSDLLPKEADPALRAREAREPAVDERCEDALSPARNREGLGRHEHGRSRVPDPCLARSEEHTSELQSRFDLVCRLLLEKKKKTNKQM